jgi:hypothetical protein
MVMNDAGLSSTSKTHPRLALVGWLGLCFAASLTGVLVSTKGWYASLAKPTWNLPGWVFGPVWTLLYILMAVAAWLVWREGGWQRQRWPQGLFLPQWLLNALWTPLFLGCTMRGWPSRKLYYSGWRWRRHFGRFGECAPSRVFYWRLIWLGSPLPGC